MGLTHLLDTDTCIYLIRQRPSTTMARFRRMELGQIGVSTVTVSELQFGAAKSLDPDRNRDALAQFLLPLEVLSYDELAARHYGDIRQYLESRGIPIGPLDMLIAAHARSLETTLVTHNVSEFKRVPGLTVETW